MTKIAVILSRRQQGGQSPLEPLPSPHTFREEQVFEKDLNTFEELVNFIAEFKWDAKRYTLTHEEGFVVLRFLAV